MWAMMEKFRMASSGEVKGAPEPEEEGDVGEEGGFVEDVMFLAFRLFPFQPK